MTLPQHVRDGRSTVQDFDLAAEERWLDVQELLARGHGTGAVYLAGYVAEFLLKSAVLRFDGAPPYAEVYPRLGPLKKWAAKTLPGLPFTNYHDVWFWAHVLRKKRADQGRPLDAPVAQNLMRTAYRVSRRWSVELRYFGFEVATASARSVFEDVAWIKKSHPTLWR